MKKWLRRILISVSSVTLALLYFTTMVFAVPSDITQLTSTATADSISLTWTKVSGSVSTMIRYSTVTYPATTADGTLAYSGSGSYTTFDGLTPGTTYYISAWAYDGALYSLNAFHSRITTLGLVSQNTTIPYTNPILPPEAFQNPSTGGWSWSPFDQIFKIFSSDAYMNGTANFTLGSTTVTGSSCNWTGLAGYYISSPTGTLYKVVTINTPTNIIISPAYASPNLPNSTYIIQLNNGGLGMPANNVVMLISGIVASFVGLITYIKWHNFFGSWFIVTILCSFLSIIHVMQWIVVGVMLLVALGVWAIEHNFQ